MNDKKKSPCTAGTVAEAEIKNHHQSTTDQKKLQGEILRLKDAIGQMVDLLTEANTISDVLSDRNFRSPRLETDTQRTIFAHRYSEMQNLIMILWDIVLKAKIIGEFAQETLSPFALESIEEARRMWGKFDPARENQEDAQ